MPQPPARRWCKRSRLLPDDPVAPFQEGYPVLTQAAKRRMRRDRQLATRACAIPREVMLWHRSAPVVMPSATLQTLADTKRTVEELKVQMQGLEAKIAAIEMAQQSPVDPAPAEMIQKLCSTANKQTNAMQTLMHSLEMQANHYRKILLDMQPLMSSGLPHTGETGEANDTPAEHGADTPDSSEAESVNQDIKAETDSMFFTAALLPLDALVHYEFADEDDIDIICDMAELGEDLHQIGETEMITYSGATRLVAASLGYRGR